LAEQNCDQQHTQDEIIDCLVNAGASMTFIENEFSRTPLHVAIYSRRFCRVRKFVQLGSPINTTDSRGESPLITALKINNVEVARFLLQTGASYQTGD
jgi:ankyrin repeat protein